MKLEIYGDYHTHTFYSDGFTKCRDNVESAIAKGLKELAFTDHGYRNPRSWSLRRKKFKAQTKELDVLREEFGDKISILQGIEADIIGADGTIDLGERDLPDMQVLVMGYHSFARPKSLNDYFRLYFNAHMRPLKYPSDGAVRRNTKAMIHAIRKYPIDILAHLNHLLKVDCCEIAKAAADYGTYIELNNKHFDFSHDLFEKMLLTGVEFIVDSDGHLAKDIGNFDSVEKFLAEHSYDPAKIVNLGKKPVFKKR